MIGAGATVYGLVATRAAERPDAPALSSGGEAMSYCTMMSRADRIAADLAARGVARGERVAVLSENRIEYSLLQLACAKLGAIVACQNWRLSAAELKYCVGLVEPVLLVSSPRYAETAGAIAGGVPVVAIDALGAEGQTRLAAEPEDAFLIIYTSGTTGLPKAAAISHRAEVARMAATRLDLGIAADDGYISWAPMFHMGGTEHLLTALMSGGCGFVIDGFDADAIADVIAKHPIGWLMLVPGTVQPLIDVLAKRGVRPRSIRAVGCMADLVPASELTAIVAATGAPYLNSFGATETGMPPLSGSLLDADALADGFGKRLSALTELKLATPDGTPVATGEIGEAWVRGPTLFSGYWNAPEANAACFVDGWFRMGDLFRQEADGYHFVGRSKYLIKSGGENIYPAEIERVLLADARVADAVAVRTPDPRWGEVPVAVIARTDASLDETEVERLCRAQLASYKRPRRVVFVALEEFPRSASGKILREAVEALVLERG